jgi:hypothetical protein
MRSLRLKRYAWQLWSQLPGHLSGILRVSEIWQGLREGWSMATIAAEFL